MKKLALKQNLYEKVREEFEKNRNIHINEIVKKFKCKKTEAENVLKQLMLNGVIDFGDMLDATYVRD